MINTKEKWMERFLQKRRFNKIFEYLEYPDILDFGGNDRELYDYLIDKCNLQYELKRYPKEINYTCCNYDYEKEIKGKKFDCIVMLAVIEHIEQHEVVCIMKKLVSQLKKDGRIIITTPTKYSIPILEIMSLIGITDRKNILEHKHYWDINDLDCLAKTFDLEIKMYRKFQFGLNQLIILDKKC